MTLSEAGGCTNTDVLDAEGVVKPGLHYYYGQPTTRYAHGVLGDAVEWASLTYLRQGSAGHGPFSMDDLVLDEDRVFEDVAPRAVDLDGDGQAEIIVVESHRLKGAQLAVYGVRDERLVKLAATPHIGTRNRWLAPIGAGDLDGDGYVEIAYIDRPHLAKTLRIWRYRDGALEPVADLAGLTNHRIGERDIGGGLRDCGDGFEMITASADWARVIASRLTAGQITTLDLGAHSGRASLNAALACQPL